jgi:negative regulator of replication initiation
MSRSISLFTNYRTEENMVTNYCGLIMKLLYEENPKSFEEALVSLISLEAKLIVGPSFSQQTKQKKSIPDLAIVQRSFSIFFETKLTNWFYDEQTFRHIADINSQAQDKILFLLSNFEADEPEIEFTDQILHAQQQYQVVIQPISFEEFVQALENVRSSEEYKKMLDEFKAYLDRSNLLPKWKYLLDVVNCAGSLQEIQSNVYICPDTGGSYSHRRAKYLGSYAHKQVDKIFEIKAVVSIELLGYSY